MTRRAQYTKFSPYMLEVKKTLRALRLGAGHSVNKGAEVLNVSRKQLEDLETVRNYGCHVDVEVIGLACRMYNVDFEDFEPSHMQNRGGYFERPRKRGKQA